jgi:hypothetical protein
VDKSKKDETDIPGLPIVGKNRIIQQNEKGIYSSSEFKRSSYHNSIMGKLVKQDANNVSLNK